MVGIERLDGPADVVLVETREGYPVDLGPVIRAAETVQARVAANPSGVTAVLLGMRIAVGKVCGREAAEVFEAWVFGEE
jgi:hypothetical protein